LEKRATVLATERFTVNIAAADEGCCGRGCFFPPFFLYDDDEEDEDEDEDEEDEDAPKAGPKSSAASASSVASPWREAWWVHLALLEEDAIDDGDNGRFLPHVCCCRVPCGLRHCAHSGGLE
jgi:hypothetical protein